jgi:hypothetical protein
LPKIEKKLAIWTPNTAILCQKIIVTSVSREIATGSENCSKIAGNCDHDIELDNSSPY